MPDIFMKPSGGDPDDVVITSGYGENFRTITVRPVGGDPNDVVIRPRRQQPIIAVAIPRANQGWSPAPTTRTRTRISIVM